MASQSTLDLRSAVSHQSTAWLKRAVLEDKEHYRFMGTAGARCIAIVRAELMKREVTAPFVDISHMTEYGVTIRLSRAVRVF